MKTQTNTNENKHIEEDIVTTIWLGLKEYWYLNRKILTEEEYDRIVSLSQMSLKEFSLLADKLTERDWSILDSLKCLNKELILPFKYFLPNSYKKSQ